MTLSWVSSQSAVANAHINKVAGAIEASVELKMGGNLSLLIAITW